MNQDQIAPNNSSAPMTSHTSKEKRSHWISWLFMLMSFLWVGWLIAQESNLLWLHLSEINWLWLTISLALGCVGALPNALIFCLLLNEQSDFKLHLYSVTRLLFTGQVVRHLPGRFWGVVYQVNSTRQQIPPVITIKVNIDFTLITLAFTVLFPTSIVLVYQVGHMLALSFFITGSVLLGLGLRLNWIHAALIFLRRWLPKRMVPSLNSYLHGKGKAYSWNSIWKTWALLLFGWLVYLVAWQTFKKTFPMFAELDMFLLCAVYSLSWVVGFLSMVTPSGLGIREATFVFLAVSLTTPSQMAFLSLFVRIWLLTIDLLLFLVILPLKRNSSDN